MRETFKMSLMNTMRTKCKAELAAKYRMTNKNVKIKTVQEIIGPLKIKQQLNRTIRDIKIYKNAQLFVVVKSSGNDVPLTIRKKAFVCDFTCIGLLINLRLAFDE